MLIYKYCFNHTFCKWNSQWDKHYSYWEIFQESPGKVFAHNEKENKQPNRKLVCKAMSLLLYRDSLVKSYKCVISNVWPALISQQEDRKSRPCSGPSGHRWQTLDPSARMCSVVSFAYCSCWIFQRIRWPEEVWIDLLASQYTLSVPFITRSLKLINF